MKRVLTYLLIGAALSGLMVVLYLADTGFLKLVEYKIYDNFFKLRGERPAQTGRVVLVAVDERSLDEEGRWPWPRTRVAELIEAVSDLGAKVIGLDMGFFEPDNRLEVKSVMDWADRIQQGEKINKAGFLFRHHPDAVLARTIASVSSDVVLGFFFHTTKEAVAHLDEAEVDRRRSSIAKFALPAVRYKTAGAMDRDLLEVHVPESNQPLIFQASPLGGYFNILPEEDGVVRRTPLILKCGQEVYPSLVLTLLARLLDQPLPVLEVQEFGLKSVVVGEVEVPVDELGQVWINYRGSRKAIESIEASDILHGRLPEGVLKGKAAIIGVTAAGLSDLDPTPFEALHPGPNIHAQVLDNILAGDYLSRPNWTAVYDILAIILLGLAASSLVAWMGLIGAIISFAGLGVGYLGFAYGLFLNGFILRTVHPLLSLTVSAGGAFAFRHFTEVREKRWIRSAFQHYLNPAVIEQLIKKPDRLNTGGEKKVLSAAFADIRNFTSISENMDPKVLSSQLNYYLDRLTEVILKNGGVLDKFIGDAMMFFFGAPIENRQHATDACRTALEMLRVQEVMNRTWAAEGLPEFKLGIGLNTGPMVVGNMGSRQRFDYTILGDSVNLASRLEGLTREYPGVDIIAGPDTVATAGDEFLFRRIDLLPVKGRKGLVEVYQLLGPREGTSIPRLIKLYEEAHSAYLNRDWEKAVQALDLILEEDPADGPALILKARCGFFQEHPPPPDWDGRPMETSEERRSIAAKMEGDNNQAPISGKLSMIMGFSEVLTTSRNPDLLFQLIIDRTSKVLDADRSSLFLVDREREEIWTKIAQVSERIVLPLGRGIAGHVARTGNTIRVEDARSLDCFDPTWDNRLGYRTRSVLCLPVKLGGERIIGVLQVLNKLKGPGFTKGDEDLLMVMANLVSVALADTGSGQA